MSNSDESTGLPTAQIRAAIVSGDTELYRDLSDEELTTYLSFLKSPAAQRFDLAVSAALDQVLSEEMRRFGEICKVCGARDGATEGDQQWMM